MTSGRPPSSVYSRDEHGIPYSTSGRLQDGQSASQERSIEQIQIVIQSATRLVWPDGFQSDIISVMRSLHFDLRQTLQQDATVETYWNIQQQCEAAINILLIWARRNQALSDEVTRDCDFIRETSSLGPRKRLQMLEAKSQRVPTQYGCEVNAVTAGRVKKYFMEWLATPNSTDLLVHFSKPTRKICRALLVLEHRVNDVAASAENLLRDAIVLHRQMSRARIAAATAIETATMFDPCSGELVNSKRAGVKLQFKKLFGITKPGGSTGSGSKRSSDKNRELNHHSSEREEVAISISDNHGPEIQPNLRPSLFALPLAPLAELEEMQLRLRRQSDHIVEDSSKISPDTEGCAGAKGHTERHDSMIENKPAPKYLENHGDTRAQEYSASVENVKMFDIQHGDNNSHKSRRNYNQERAILYDRELYTGNQDQLTQAEVGMLKACEVKNCEKPESATEKAGRVKHRHRALRELEGGIQIFNEKPDEDLESDLTEMQQAEKKAEARIMALAKLEGLGESQPYCDDKGGQTRPFSFVPDEVE
ncbi:hypothetical protein IWZ01DRAFT_477486 [Phyllosticta capitalensis]